MKADLVLVSCVKSKVDHPAPAKDLYMRSAWFRKARAYAEHHGKKWFVLSAAHGLIHPDEVTDPYDVTLNGASVEFRSKWANLVDRQLRELKERRQQRELPSGDR